MDQATILIVDQVKIRRKKHLNIGILLFLITIAIIVVSIGLGKAEISIKDIISIIVGKITVNPNLYSHIKPYKVAIVWDIRLPRILIGVIVGTGLAVAGTVFQSLLMNPLADPYTIGVSTGAAFGASLIIYINLFLSNIQIPITPFAFLSAFITLILVLKIANREGIIKSSNLIIAGIIVSSILSAGISFLKNAAGEEVSAIIFWLMGSLASRTWTHVLISAPIILISVIICTYYSDDLNLLCLGEKDARSLGVNTNKMRKIFLIIGAIITAVCVSVSGIIGFIGLIIPHLLRFSVTSNNRVLIPLSGLLGGVILVLADNISRVLFAAEIPVGVLTTLLGGPFFIYIFIKKNKYIQ
ncbi:FecCD family ABC transporter permease [Paramaledivibacter caminithermalis]|jgi:iron complex transport system permease protein|uniref:Iron complex transport system permease protein n=1 Tax=Paramaledivibacter caminithermalis (strain DSM 15212 / CIP 107654 / DViRD3) TaxID=1121301 RepID=A0A1M6KUQ8_PARC5|nr:iron ABC transporter permease [Paramaledivibacter caminithermalis]SHJ62701.1 iron complex transport system permease protein [Paramaledivibacter caminithermalis DSM 15212]